jgi:hypothetical protein
VEVQEAYDALQNVKGEHKLDEKKADDKVKDDEGDE